LQVVCKYVLACAFSLVAFSGSQVLAVTFTPDGRQTLTEFATQKGQDPASLELQYAATGMVICSGVYSTGQLTLKKDVITTTAHAFYNQAGNSRGDLNECVFSVTLNGQRHISPIMASTLQVGSTNPYSEAPGTDWAVARLAKPVQEASPYILSSVAAAGTAVMLLANRHEGWRQDGQRAIEQCAIRNVEPLSALAPHELAIDCSTGNGASGSALLLNASPHELVGILVGWRSRHPAAAGPYSSEHMNFGVAVEGAFRAAIMAVASLSSP
jgi:V8-like Glu-specific endopeptidase